MAQVSFRGNIGKVRGLKFSQDNKPRFHFSVGEPHRRLNQQTQEWEDIGTTWWNVTAFGRLSEDLADIIQEGAKQQVVVFGRSQTRFYQTDDGRQGSSLDVVADSVGVVHRALQTDQQNQNYSNNNPWGGSQYNQQQQQQGGWGQPPAGNQPPPQNQPPQGPPPGQQNNVWAGGQPGGQPPPQQDAFGFDNNGPPPF